MRSQSDVFVPCACRSAHCPRKASAAIDSRRTILHFADSPPTSGLEQHIRHGISAHCKRSIWTAILDCPLFVSLVDTMAPQPYPALKHARTLASSSSASSPSSDAVINIVFGLCAVAIGAVTVWQSRKAWRTWRGDHRRASEEGGGMPLAVCHLY
jgi:hypothetical protein